MIEVENLSKRYGEELTVDGLSFVVQPGIASGFLGSNGAGKSTTMRMIAGLDEPTAGRVVVNGRRYLSARAPMAEWQPTAEAAASAAGYVAGLFAGPGDNVEAVEPVFYERFTLIDGGEYMQDVLCPRCGAAIGLNRFWDLLNSSRLGPSWGIR
jgi:ABC-type cobalamin/Fe3+-siderophores transport system ATPase subunit